MKFSCFPNDKHCRAISHNCGVRKQRRNNARYNTDSDAATWMLPKNFQEKTRQVCFAHI